MSFGTGGALSLDISDGYHTGREKARSETYEDMSSTHRKILRRFYTFATSVSDVPSRKEGSAFQVMRCAAWDAAHKHQGYPLCYGTALALQEDLDSPPSVTVRYSAAVPVLQQKKRNFSHV